MTPKPRKPLPRPTKPLKRTALKRSTSRLARTRLKPTKPSGRARPEERLATWCEAAIPGVCLGRATHRHHVRRRAQGVDDSWENTLDVCGTDGCHGWIHANPAESYERGWLVRGVT